MSKRKGTMMPRKSDGNPDVGKRSAVAFWHSDPLRSRLAEGLRRYDQSRGKVAGKAEIETADRVVAGEIRFLGFGQGGWKLVGRRNIDWRGEAEAHIEWTAQLNRFYYLYALADAYLDQRNEAYAEAARDYVTDWLRAHPTHEGWIPAGYDSTLDLAIRIRIWLETIPCLAASPALDEAFLDNLIESTVNQLAYLQHNLKPGGNWRVAHAYALLAAGLILEFHPKSSGLRLLGVRVLNDAFRRQVLPDGAHIERTPAYHQWVTDMFAACWRIGRARPELGLRMDTNVLNRMHDYLSAAVRPDGLLNSLHDTPSEADDPWFWNAHAGRSRFCLEAGLPDEPPPLAAYFPAAGQACLRDGWDEHATYITFDATTWGGGHCHLSRNAIQVYAFGQPMLIDPGILNYDTRDPLMMHGKSTRAHNTLCLNGWTQSPADPTPLCFRSAPGYECVASKYSGGYWQGQFTWSPLFGPGIWAEHHRALLWVKGRCLVVLDLLVRTAMPKFDEEYVHPRLQANWQFAPGTVEVDAAAGRAAWRRDGVGVLMLFPLTADGTTFQVHAGETEPPCGWIEGRRPAPQLSLLSAPLTAHEAHGVTVIIPFEGEAPAVARIEAQGPLWSGNAYRLGWLCLEWADGTRDEVVWSRELASMIGVAHGLNTDAALAHVTRDRDGRILRSFELLPPSAL